jgi:electron transfer flavoprotein beta subunit
MLIITLVKGVPARTTQVQTVSGVLKREEMELVLNPHDAKAIEAAYYIKRMVGGKLICLSMGPEPKIVPIMKELYEPKEDSRLVPRICFGGVDQNILLSDRRMAGADTWATSYTLAKGIQKIIQLHLEAVDRLEQAIGTAELGGTARALHLSGLIPHHIYSELPAIKDSLVPRFLRGDIGVGDLRRHLQEYRENLMRFIIIAGMKTTDGETGNTGPQTAEALSQMMGRLIPSVAFVREMEISPDGDHVIAVRSIGSIIQKLRIPIPCLLTVHTEYEPKIPDISLQRQVRVRGYIPQRGKVEVWNADFIGADPSKLGLMGSPTIVGPGYEVGRPPAQKVVGESLIFARDVERTEWLGKAYGPFKAGELVSNLPQDLVEHLRSRGLIRVFTLEDMIGELFGGLKVVARAV